MFQINETLFTPDEDYVCEVKVTRTRTPFFPEAKSAKQRIRVKKPPPAKFVLMCLENCIPGDAFKTTVLSYTCMLNCIGKNPKWTTIPPNATVIEKLEPDPLMGKITFPAEFFSPGDNYTFTATIGETKENVTVRYKFITPKIELLCVVNCKFDPRMETTLTVVCSADCEHTNYKWESIPPQINVERFMTDTRETVNIPGGTLTEGQEVTLIVHSWKSTTKYKMKMVETRPEIRITCTLKDGGSPCGDPDPRQAISMRVICSAHCIFLHFNWFVEPSTMNFIPNDHTSYHRDQLEVPANTFADDDKIMFTVLTGKMNTTMKIHFKVKIPTLHIECVNNCPGPANPLLETTLAASCLENCQFLDYVWDVSDVRPGQVQQWALNHGETLQVPAQAFHDHQKVTFTLISGKGKTSIKKNYVEPTPKINIECEANCDKKPNPLKETVLRVVCDPQDTMCAYLRYVWDISPLPANFSWSANVVFGDANATIILKERSFLDGDDIKVTVTGRKAHASKLLVFREPVAQLKLQCTQNCDPSHPSFPVILNASCENFCEGVVYIWTLSPLPDKFPWTKMIFLTEGNQSMAIQPNAFKDQDTIAVKVASYKGSADLNLKFKDAPATLNVTCDPPCNETHNPLNKLAIWVNCTKFCIHNQTYTWSFTPADTKLDWDKKIIMQSNNESLHVLPETFADDATITVEVTTGKGDASASLHFVEPTPNISIICVRNCWEGSPLNDTILLAVCTAECSNVSTYQWDLRPPPVNVEFNTSKSPNNATITIKAEAYKDGDVVEVALSMRKGNATGVVRFVELESELNLTCIDNCSPSSPFKEVTLFVSCLTNCIKLEYNWTIDPLPPNFNWKKSIKLDKTNTTMKIAKDLFNDTDVIKVTVTSRKSKKELVVQYLEPPVEMVISCQSCVNNTANPQEPVTFNVTCTKYCDRLKYMWKMIPLPPHINWKKDVKFGKKNVTMTLHGHLYPDDSSVRVTAMTSKREVFIDVYFVEPTPQLSLNCNTCLAPFRAEHTHDLTFSVKCLEECKHTNYTWEITPQLRNFTWKQSIIFGKKNQTLKIKKYTYENNEKVLVTVLSGKGKASMEVLYKSPPPVLTLICEKNCPEHLPHPNPLRPTILKINCQYDCKGVTYLWRIYPLPSGFNYTKNIKISEKKDRMTIAPESFVDCQMANVSVWIDKQENITTNISLTFIEVVPNITLKCIENCAYNPRRPIKLEVHCLKDCEKLTYNWTLTPESLYVKWDNQTGKILTIGGGWYIDNSTVLVHVQVRKADANMTLLFVLPDWDGDCFVEPPSGFSGVTQFAIECEDFIAGAMFRIYQSYPQNPRKLGVLLTYSSSKFSGPFFLSKTEAGAAIMVAVGPGWETMKEVPLKVDVQSFLKMEKKRKEFADVGPIKMKILGSHMMDFKMIVARKNYFGAVQLAAVLDSTLDETEESFRRHFMKHIIAGIVKLASGIEPTQCISILIKLANDKSYHDAFRVRLLMEGVRAASEHMFQAHNDAIYNPATLDTFAADVLWLSSRLLSHLAEMQEILQVGKVSPDYPLYTDFMLPRTDIKRHIKATTVELFAAIDALANVVRVPGEKRTVTSDDIQLSVADMNASAAKASLNLTVQGAKSFIITTPTIARILENFKLDFRYQLVHFQVNPFWWQKTAKEINTEVLQLAVHGITLLPAPVDVYLSLNKTPSGLLEGEIKELAVFEFEVVEKTLITVSFDKVDAPYNATVGSCIPVETTFKEEGTFINSTGQVVNFISNKTFVYVGIEVPPKGSVKYKFQYMASDCFYWGASELSWRRDLCTVAKEQLAGYVHCRCRHLSYFGARAYVPKSAQRSTIAETLQVGETVSDYVIAICTSVALGVFFVMMVWAHWKDNSLSAHSTVMGLEDNVPGDSEVYLVMVATGLASAAGTTADVVLQVTGTLAKSRAHRLVAEDGKPLQRNNEQFFAMFTKDYLGDLVQIKLWHNSKGTKPHWYCERVIIEHLRTRRKYMFVVEKWFSLLYGDGTTDGVFQVTTQTVKLSFSRKLRECIRGSHHLLTLLTQRPRAGTTKETVIVGFASCATAMMTAMLLMSNKERSDTVTFIVIAFLSALVTLPVTVTLDFLFRNSA